jgi:DNA-binding NarL/FixJ family response regulator
MPLLSGIEAARLIKESCPNTKIAILTSLEEGKSIMSSFVSGADAYLLKDTSPEQLKLLLKCINMGFCILSDSAKTMLFDELLHCSSVTPGVDQLKSLKNEDIQIIRYISEGKSNSEIGEALGYASGTVKNKVTRLLEATGTESRSQLLMFALKNKLL